jgi:hypothetical protein
MQLLCIAGEPVLTFFDSGSNAHLVDGAFAERAVSELLTTHAHGLASLAGGIFGRSTGYTAVSWVPTCATSITRLSVRASPGLHLLSPNLIFAPFMLKYTKRYQAVGRSGFVTQSEVTK